MRAIRGIWHWRHNPLRRTTDLVEAWVALTGLLLILFVAPLIGALVGGAAQESLQRSVRDQHASRHRVTASVVRELKRSSLDVDPDGVSAGNLRSRVLARWAAPDGSEHRGSVLAGLRDPHPGDHFRIWTDGQGRLVARPLDSATATTHATLAGVGAALTAALLVEAGRRIVVWRMVRRRYDRWEREWDRAGPDWGRTGTGS
ncbi:Rv1733c family protein [Streptomyces sp. NPDC003470]|uniref:Rv1733c family protein n=1 Tax=unclassified Streptomyces TaxID=2593676 RepID=UPI00365EA18B